MWLSTLYINYLCHGHSHILSSSSWIHILILGTKQVEFHLAEVESGEPHLANDGLAHPLLLLETHQAHPHQLLDLSPHRFQRIQQLPASQPVSVRGVIHQAEDQEQGAGQVRGWVL